MCLIAGLEFVTMKVGAEEFAMVSCILADFQTRSCMLSF